MEERTKKDFVSYKDDDDKIIGRFVEILKITDTFVKFKLHRYVFTIPMSRVIKIKETEEVEK